MRDILIIFCVLLVLLIIISTLGGSIRPLQEPFRAPMGPEWFMNPADIQQLESNSSSTTAVMQEQPTSIPQSQRATIASVSSEAFVNSAGTTPSGFDGADAFASF